MQPTFIFIILLVFIFLLGYYCGLKRVPFLIFFERKIKPQNISKELKEFRENAKNSVSETYKVGSEILGHCDTSLSNLGDLMIENKNSVTDNSNHITELQNNILNSSDKFDKLNALSKELLKLSESIINLRTALDVISNDAKEIQTLTQTAQLLSFNASIQAARAGEHGKSFNAVAESIRDLATMSNQLTVSIFKNINKRKIMLEELSQSITAVTKEALLSAKKSSANLMNLRMAS